MTVRDYEDLIGIKIGLQFGTERADNIDRCWGTPEEFNAPFVP